jgi:hypothetical protein
MVHGFHLGADSSLRGGICSEIEHGIDTLEFTHFLSAEMRRTRMDKG